VASVGSDRATAGLRLAVSGTTAAGKRWLTNHARTVKGKTVLEVDGEKRKLPRAKLSRLARGVTSF
jgi:hypothetical protein